MQLLKLKSRLHRFEYFADFAKEFELGDKDLVITNEFLYEPFMNRFLRGPFSYLSILWQDPKRVGMKYLIKTYLKAWGGLY